MTASTRDRSRKNSAMKKADAQDAVRQFWDTTPCNSQLSSRAIASKEYFLEVEAQRYECEEHILEMINRFDWEGKSVLEIGTGVGTDARKIIEKGGLYTGINIDYGSTQMTRNALKTFRLPGGVMQCNATRLPFEPGSFDVVYSFGVLICIPEVEKAVAEIYRVLKPGGKMVIMLYNRSSINYYLEILFLRKLGLRLLLLPGAVSLFSALGFPRWKLKRHIELFQEYGHISNEEWLNRNTDGPDNPYIRIYSKREAEQLLHEFRIDAHNVRFFDHRHWGVLGRAMPKAFIRVLGRFGGWHRIIYATKSVNNDIQ